MKKRLFAAVLATFLIGAVFAGCKHESGNEPKKTDGTSDSTTPASTEWSYDYGDLNYNGKDIRFMTLDTLWDMYVWFRGLLRHCSPSMRCFCQEVL